MSNLEDVRAGITALTVVGYVILWVAMITEVANTPEQAFATGDKTLWLALVIFTGILGFIAYRVYGRR